MDFHIYKLKNEIVSYYIVMFTYISVGVAMCWQSTFEEIE